MLMGKGHGSGQFLRREIAREGPHTEAGPGQINGIRTVKNGHIQLFHIPGGGKKFQFSHFILE